MAALFVLAEDGTQPESKSVGVVCQSCLTLFATPWTVALQAPPSTGFSRQEYWSELPFPTPGDLSDPGIEHTSPALQVDSLPLSHVGSPPSVGGWEVNYDASSQCNEIQPIRDVGSPQGVFLGVSPTKAGPYCVSLWRLSEVFLEGYEKSVVLVLEVSLLGGRGGAPLHRPGLPPSGLSGDRASRQVTGSRGPSPRVYNPVPPRGRGACEPRHRGSLPPRSSAQGWTQAAPRGPGGPHRFGGELRGHTPHTCPECVLSSENL